MRVHCGGLAAGKRKLLTKLTVSGCVVEHTGLEPVTSTLPVSRSSQMS